MDPSDQKQVANEELRLQEHRLLLMRRAVTAVEAAGLGGGLYLSQGRLPAQWFFGLASWMWFMDLMFGFRKVPGRRYV